VSSPSDLEPLVLGAQGEGAQVKLGTRPVGKVEGVVSGLVQGWRVGQEDVAGLANDARGPGSDSIEEDTGGGSIAGLAVGRASP
jgi:hypothetical protein